MSVGCGCLVRRGVTCTSERGPGFAGFGWRPRVTWVGGREESPPGCYLRRCVRAVLTLCLKMEHKKVSVVREDVGCLCSTSCLTLKQTPHLSIFHVFSKEDWFGAERGNRPTSQLSPRGESADVRWMRRRIRNVLRGEPKAAGAGGSAGASSASLVVCHHPHRF